MVCWRHHHAAYLHSQSRKRRTVANLASSFEFNEAVVLHKSGAIDDAVRIYRRILDADPANDEAIRLLGTAYVEQGRLDDAIIHIRKAVRRLPKDAYLHTMLGELLQATSRFDKALQCFNRALSLAPNFAEAHAARGTVLATLNRHEEAIGSFDRALALRSNFVEVLMNRGNSLRALKRFAEALLSYDAAIQVRPDLSEVHFSRGFVLEDECRWADAIESFDRALALAPPTASWLGQVHCHRAMAHHYLGHTNLALAGIAQAIAAASDDDEVIFTASLIELSHGRWLDAWPKFERRLKLESSDPAKSVPSAIPLWSGEALTDELLVLKDDLGIGDQIQFCCFAADLANRGVRVALWTRPRMVALLKTVPHVERVFARIEDVRHEKARWLPMMSLPRVLGTTVDSIPQAAPFLFADPERVAKWRETLGTHGFKVGIIWQGNPDFRTDRDRSIALQEFAPLAAIPGIRLVSLQKGTGSEQIARVPFRSQIETLDENFDAAGTFLDTAAVMMNLDLVVASDTSVAHLAGALGRPLFVALSLVPDWRWLLDRDDCPWYSSARLFRQTHNRDWTSVLTRIADAVRHLQRSH